MSVDTRECRIHESKKEATTDTLNVGYDNTVIQATTADLAEALALAGAEQARLWVRPVE